MSRTVRARVRNPAIKPELVDFFEPYPRLELTRGDHDTYQRFRSLEPGLVSCLDEQGISGDAGKAPGVLVLLESGQAMGALSFVLEKNQHRSDRFNRFARIDLVIVDDAYRGLGVGRLLISCAMTHLLQSYGRSLYSISCLAAHPAVEKVLNEISFQGRPVKDRNFRHMELRLEKVQLDHYTRQCASSTAEMVQTLNYRLRQERGKTPQ